MSRGWEAFDVGPDLREQNLGCPPTNASDCVQALGLVPKRLQSLADFLVELLDHRVESVQVRQLLPEKKLLMSCELPGQRTFQLFTLAAQATLGHVRQHRRVGRATNQRGQHLASGATKNVAGHV